MTKKVYIFQIFLLLILVTSILTSTTQAMTKAEFLALFLDKNDFSKPLRMVQDSREDKPAPGDDAFMRYGGQFAGFRVWMDSRTDAILWRLVDIRWVFPDEQRAKKYH
ncbi:MAG: hypothetical protein KJ630_05065 [Proteobacteria bacterium]|nr:hypothetical protein [Pseudomonadota bacterium]